MAKPFVLMLVLVGKLDEDAIARYDEAHDWTFAILLLLFIAT
jgi:hypothetical protein